jgi:tryptophanyl-tRNA synthetase
VGDVEVKRRLVDALERFLAPIRERRARYEGQPARVDEIIVDGSRKARREAQITNRLAREAMGIDYFQAERELAGTTR